MNFANTFIRYQRGLLIAGISTLLAGAFFTGISGAEAEDNATCIGCHTTRGLAAQFPGSEKLPLTIDVAALRSSVHGNLDCTACHENIRKFPHPENTAGNFREFQLESSRRCETCHREQAEQGLDGNHAHALASGNTRAAVCTDCHGSHGVGPPDFPRHRMSTTCGRCHGNIYAQYVGSAHGQSLLESENPDVPVCTDCHASHNQEDPTTQAFRLKSPGICAACHADEKLMRKYNITADVFNTYVADFHGLTVTLFDKEHPDQPMNAAVCTDCHGVHDIQKVTDANSSVIKQNLLVTCRKCHPDASLNFPDSWLGHFLPSRDRYPMVYWVNVFYKYLIPITIGGMIVFVLVDAGGRITRRLRKGNSGNGRRA